MVQRIKITPDFFVQVRSNGNERFTITQSVACPLLYCQQMAIQLAHWRLHKEAVATYETAHTRLFYHGRTETSELACSLYPIPATHHRNTASYSPLLCSEDDEC